MIGSGRYDAKIETKILRKRVKETDFKSIQTA